MSAKIHLYICAVIPALMPYKGLTAATTQTDIHASGRQKRRRTSRIFFCTERCKKRCGRSVAASDDRMHECLSACVHSRRNLKHTHISLVLFFLLNFLLLFQTQTQKSIYHWPGGREGGVPCGAYKSRQQKSDPIIRVTTRWQMFFR